MSHCWGAPWGDLVMAAADGADSKRVVWIDIFSVRQWPGNVKDLDFRGVISKCSAAIVACSINSTLAEDEMTDESSHHYFLSSSAGATAKKNLAFFRLWCVVELAAAVHFGLPIVIKAGTCSPSWAKSQPVGPMERLRASILHHSETEAGASFTASALMHMISRSQSPDAFTYSSNGAKNQLINLAFMIDASKAECTVQSDLDREMATIEGEGGGRHRGHQHRFERHFKRCACFRGSWDA
jgi:hypothetical protein